MLHDITYSISYYYCKVYGKLQGYTIIRVDYSIVDYVRLDAGLRRISYSCKLLE